MNPKQMNDIELSRYKARVSQGWSRGEKNRIGDPFHSDDDDLQPYKNEKDDTPWFLEFMTNYNEKYPTPKNIRTKDFNEVLKYSEKTLSQAMDLFGPFLNKKKWKIESDGQAHMRTQDYAFIKTYAKKLQTGCHHLDLGPGLGSHAIYSLKKLKSRYFGIEAQPPMYKTQKHFYRFLASKFQETSKNPFRFFDCVDAETFGLTWKEIHKFIKNDKTMRINLVPSWMFELVPDKSVDLVTGTWMLNEIGTSALLWLISNCTRVMKKGSYFYINDNNKDRDQLKPGRNTIDYDELLIKLGYKEVKRMKMINRVNFRGSPRIFLKNTNKKYTWKNLVDMCVGKFAVTAHGTSYTTKSDLIPEL